MSRSWLVVGSSPAARRLLPLARRLAGPGHHSITTNAGLLLAPCPTWYLLHDWVAARKFRHLATAARRNGTKIIRAALDEPHLGRMRQLVPFADFEARTTASEPTRWKPRALTSPGFSGALCAQFAVMRGASRLVMVGMDGYLSKPGRIRRETFDGRLGHSRQFDRTMNNYGPLLLSMMAHNPGVSFALVGRPVYSSLLLGVSNCSIITPPGGLVRVRW